MRSEVPHPDTEVAFEMEFADRIVAAEEKTMSETKKPLSKTDVINALAESTGLSRKDVSAVFSGLTDLIGKEIGKKGPQVFNIPGLMKINVITKPATKATQRPNPFKPGEMMTVKAKPARKVVKIRALKALKDMA